MPIFKTRKRKFLPKKPVEIIFQAIGNEAFPLGPNSICYIARNRPGNVIAQVSSTHPYMHITARKSMHWIWNQRDYTNQIVPKGKYIAKIQKPVKKSVQFEISLSALRGLKIWAKRNIKYVKGAAVFAPLHFEPNISITLNAIAWGSDLISEDPPNFDCETRVYIPDFLEEMWLEQSLEQLPSHFSELVLAVFEALTSSIEKAQGALLLNHRQALLERKRDIQQAALTLEAVIHTIVRLIKFNMERNFEKYSYIRLTEVFERDRLHLYFADTFLDIDATLTDYLTELGEQLLSISYSVDLLKRRILDKDIREIIPDTYK